MQRERNPVAEYIADHTKQLAEIAKAARLDALADILKMAHLEAMAVVVGPVLTSDAGPT